MADEKLLTVRDVSLILGLSEKEVIDLAESGKIPAYKIGGIYLRFKREQVEIYKKSLTPVSLPKKDASRHYSFKERVKDFFYFNDFYLLSVILILLILFIIFKGY